MVSRIGSHGPRAHRRPIRNRSWLVLIALSAALVISACTSNGGGDEPGSTTADLAAVPTTSGSAEAGSSGAAAVADYETAPCPNPIYPAVRALDLGPEFTCGYLTVPENRDAPGGKTIRIAVAQIKATSASPADDPILYLAGGPGGSGLLSAVQRVQTGWNSDRDVIFIDQRGAWKSEPLLACPEIDAFLAESVSLSSTAPDTAAKSGAATRACRDRIVADGWDPSAYNTTENAADIADLRIALGIDEWNLYGVSYGTDLALQTLRNHPDGIRSVVLDSVVPPQVSAFDTFWPSAAHGYRQLFDDCAADAACNAAYPNIANEFTAQVNQLTEQPRTVTVPAPSGTGTVDVLIDGYKLANLVLTASLSPGSIAPIPAMIDNLANGDGTQAAGRLLAGVPPSGVTGYGLALGVFCAEHVPFTTPEQMLATGRAVLPEFPDAVLALAPQAPWIFGDCGQWDVTTADPAVTTPVTSDIPVLILNGSLDAITAPLNATTVAAGLTDSTPLDFPDSAHDVLIWSPDCAVQVMHGFLDQPDGFDRTCVAGLTVPSFTVG